MTSTQKTLDWDNLKDDQTEQISADQFVRMSTRARSEFLYEGRNERLYQRYLKWTKESAKIVGRFLMRADALWDTGWRHYSQWAIVGVMRYYLDLEKGPNEQFRIPNGFIAFMARDYVLLHPERFGFFTLRKLGGRA